MAKKNYGDSFVADFGIEIHAELLTKTKAFSNAKAYLFKDNPNVNVNQVDIGYPGAKPTVNKKMVNLAYRAAKSLDMKIDTLLRFDRKNYFYPDLPKGFQITQYYYPIGKNGKITIIKGNGKEKDIEIKQLHIEEDTAKQIKKGKDIYFDFNRSGIPLIEIVSGSRDIDDVDEVIEYVKQLRSQLMFLNISSGNLFDGSFRVDVNVSIRKKGASELGTRVEIKNLNSFKNIKKALEYEINYQIETIKKNGKVEFVTKKFDEETEKTIVMRKKDKNIDYNYIPEGNISPIKLTPQTLTSFDSYPIIKISSVIKKLTSDKLDESQITLISQYNKLYKAYKNLIADFDKKKVASFMTTIFYSEANNKNINLQKYVIPEVKISRIIKLLFENKITNTETRTLIKDILDNKNIDKDLEFYYGRNIVSVEELLQIIEKIVNENPKTIKEYSKRPERVKKFVMGQIMKETKGKVNAKVANKELENFLKKYE